MFIKSTSVIVDTHDDDVCGVFPFVLPSWFPMTPCCENHDIGYEALRNQAIYSFINSCAQPTDIEKYLDTGEWLDMEYKQAVKDLDSLFLICMEDASRKQTIYKRWLWLCIKSVFYELVSLLGWPIWKAATIKQIDKLVLHQQNCASLED